MRISLKTSSHKSGTGNTCQPPRMSSSSDQVKHAPKFVCRDLSLLRCIPLFVLLMACQLPPEELQGRVVKVIDGDTIEVLQGKTKTRVRLYAIDAPERGQDFYNQSKQFLASQVAGQTVRVVANRVDRWKRVVGDVYLQDGTHINAQMIAEGWAWHFIRYSNSAALGRLEDLARQQRKGLWRQSRAVAPWEFREQKRQKKE